MLVYVFGRPFYGLSPSAIMAKVEGNESRFGEKNESAIHFR